MALHSGICELFGVEHPILNAPMGGGDAPGRLAAAVSEAGGLGMISTPPSCPRSSTWSRPSP